MFVSELVALAVAPAGGNPGDQDGRHRAECRIVVLALGDDQPVIAGGKGGVDPPGLVGGEEQSLAKAGIPRLGDSLVSGNQP